MKITAGQINALSRINTHNGWTNRPYSYIERSLIMTKYGIRKYGADMGLMCLLHYVPIALCGTPPHLLDAIDDYDELIEGHLQDLYSRYNLNVTKKMKDDMLHVISQVTSVEFDTVYDDAPVDEIAGPEDIVSAIRSETYRGDLAIPAFWGSLEALRPGTVDAREIFGDVGRG